MTNDPDFIKEFEEFLENIDKPKPPEPRLKLVSEAPVRIDLEAKRQRNREREQDTLAEERRQIDEAHQKTVEFCKRRGIKPPAHPIDGRRELRERKLAADRALRLQLSVDYHMEMKHFHEAAEREFRENDILGLWR
jgi:hypothetical protein